MLDAIIISDLHLGSDNCEAKALAQFLDEIHDGQRPTARLILNGDVFDSIDFRRLKKSHWKVLSLIRKLSDQIAITWLIGNHDGPIDFVSHLLGVDVGNEYILESGSRKILLLHGHRFDQFLDSHPILTWVGDVIYWFLQKIDPSHNIARFAKHRTKAFMRNAELIQRKSVELARKQHCDAVCCGHTHHAVADVSGPVAYFNSGCWTERPSHFLTVKDGRVALCTYAAPVTETAGAELSPV